MRRAVAYVVLLGLLSGAVAGVAAFGLPLAAEDAGQAPGGLADYVLERGLSLADAAQLAGGAALAVLLTVAALDLYLAARRTR